LVGAAPCGVPGTTTRLTPFTVATIRSTTATTASYHAHPPGPDPSRRGGVDHTVTPGLGAVRHPQHAPRALRGQQARKSPAPGLPALRGGPAPAATGWARRACSEAIGPRHSRVTSNGPARLARDAGKRRRGGDKTGPQRAAVARTAAAPCRADGTSETERRLAAVGGGAVLEFRGAAHSSAIGPNSGLTREDGPTRRDSRRGPKGRSGPDAQRQRQQLPNDDYGQAREGAIGPERRRRRQRNTAAGSPPWV
jgi:hypothetical protein